MDTLQRIFESVNSTAVTPLPGDADELRREIARVKWWHRIELAPGIVTPGMVDNQGTLSTLSLPERLGGVTVLDVGAWDGFYSFEAERRGAKRVLATDSYCWGGGGWGSQAGFQLARRTLNSRVEDREIDVLDLSPEEIGAFDLVLFLGVLYHMRHPLLALERIFSVTKKQLILETYVEELPTTKPAMVFYPGTELNQDATNWWGPNAAAVEAMLKVVGFNKVETVSKLGIAFPPPPPPPGMLQRLRPGAARNRERDRDPQRWEGRMVFHAWR